MKDNCYKGSKTELGIHKDFYMELLNKHTKVLMIDRPINFNEAELLVEFVYGMKLKIEFERFTNRLKVSGWGFDNKQSQRDIAIAKLEGADCLEYLDTYNIRKRVIGNFRWHIGRNVAHNDYNDYQFNRGTSGSSYDIEATVLPQTIFGIRGSGGIGYGDNDITHFSELERIEHFYNNNNSELRPEYIEYIKSLRKRNSIYRYNELKAKISQFDYLSV